jgi:2-keto-4-pentenoate hydratase/2-oxohepta-3-ene-1,7-dioic acid hydratase in catechol pathway
MRYVRFRDSAGTVRRGNWTGDDGAEIVAHPEHGSRITLEDETFAADDVEILPPCEPSKIVCVGLNYADHAAETDSEIPDRPMLFLKAPNTVASHGEAVELLPDKERIDHEAEIGVVIGETARNVPKRDVADHVAGFTCVNDLSNRGDQRVEQNWVRGKAFDNAAPIGPAIATPDEVPKDASVELRLNGETRQSSSREEFIFSVPDLVEEITTYLTLEPGDVISTGTPAGVGKLTDGDEVEVEVEGVGTLRHSVSIP